MHAGLERASRRRRVRLKPGIRQKGGEVGRSTRGLRLACAVGAAGAALLLVTGAATAAPAAQTFAVAVPPGILTAGGSAFAVGSFTNNGTAVTGVAITLTFPFPVTVLGRNCGTLRILTRTVVCLLGRVGPGQTATAVVPFTVPAGSTPGSALQVQGIAGFLSTGVPRAGLLRASGSGTVYASGDAAHQGTCASSTAVISATADNHGISLSSVPLPSDPSLVALGCTPVGVAVDPPPSGFHTDSLSVDLPFLSAPAPVTLTFPDEFLPGGYDSDIHATLPPLHEFDNAGNDLGPVQPCAAGPTLPTGRDACIVSINANDDDDRGAPAGVPPGDAGTIDLLVQGSGLGDPRFAG